MATNLKNLSSYCPNQIPSVKGVKFGIVVSEWNEEITNALYKGAKETLLKHEACEEDIVTIRVPGSFELTSGAHLLVERTDVDAVICLGCVIKGETPHFDFICQGVSYGISQLNLRYNIPFIFGVLTTMNQQQALDRAGGKHGNKGNEAAISAIKMCEIIWRLKK
ncbi:MAG: 6,7-dimethyl-8-ribityllumazine synthase [Cytophagaceae bacterium]|jgi:6,7-dimethyl-8-ribityllumazine synthase|nr:6,7-dimethyl-8-ribityllumazine synthase [Cytophagaceae bacterium]